MSPRPREEEKQRWVDKRVHPNKWTEEEFLPYRWTHPSLSGELSIRGLDSDLDDEGADVSWMGERWEQELFQESADVDFTPSHPTPDAGPSDIHTLTIENSGKGKLSKTKLSSKFGPSWVVLEGGQGDYKDLCGQLFTCPCVLACLALSDFWGRACV
jgi:hypothetical protein